MNISIIVAFIVIGFIAGILAGYEMGKYSNDGNDIAYKQGYQDALDKMDISEEDKRDLINFLDWFAYDGRNITHED